MNDDEANKYYERLIASYVNRVVTPHKSHDMTEWDGGHVLVNPFGGGTPRFHSVQKCKRCGLEQAKSVAGAYAERDLLFPCYDDDD